MTRKILPTISFTLMLIVSTGQSALTSAVVVSGKVTDKYGVPAIGVVVSFTREPELDTFFNDTTNGEGMYEITIEDVVVSVEEDATRQKAPEDFVFLQNYPWRASGGFVRNDG